MVLTLFCRMANISHSIQGLETSRLSNISDPSEKARVQALFKTCQDMVKEANNLLDRFTDMASVKKRPGVRAKSKRFMYVQPCLRTSREQLPMFFLADCSAKEAVHVRRKGNHKSSSPYTSGA